MVDKTWTSFEVYCEKMGWNPDETTQDDIERVGGKRGQQGKWDSLINNTHVWKQCGICGHKFVVNNYSDHKSRTPRLAGFIICVECDPRHAADRRLKEGYRLLHPRRTRILKMAQITKALATQPCLKKGKKKCKCISCSARRLMDE